MESENEVSIGRKRMGRPPLPPSWRRIQKSTTITIEMADAIDAEHWKLNELIADGIGHRRFCVEERKEMLEKTEKLAALLEATITEKERYAARLRDLGVDIDTEGE